MFGESYHAALPFFASFVAFVDASLTTGSTLWSCRLFFDLDSTTATSSWSGFLPTSRHNLSQCTTLRLVSCPDFVVVITLQTRLQLCTGCACQNEYMISRLLTS